MSGVISAIVSFICGFVIGYCLFHLICLHISSGDLRVDNSDDQTHLFLELNEDVSKTVKKKFVALKVIVKDFLPKKN